MLHASVNSKPFQSCKSQYITRILRLEPDDVIIPPFVVIAVTVATQGETPLLTLFSFCGESGWTVSDWTHLSGRFSDWQLFSFSNCLLNSQLQRVDLGSTCAWRRWRYALFVFRVAFYLWAISLKYISAVFCGKKVILAAQEMLSSLDLMNIHRLTDNDKVVSLQK